MKKINILPFVVSIIFFISSCDSDAPGTVTVPIFDTSEIYVRENSAEEEREYHRNLGMTIIESIDSDIFRSIYGNNTYEDQYQLAVDYLYRAKLDIDILTKNGLSNAADGKYKELIADFLEDNEPKCLLPQNSIRKNRLNHFWRDPLMRLFETDEQKTVSNEKLMRIYEFDCLCNVRSGGNIKETLSHYPLVSERILPGSPRVLLREYDAQTLKTALTVESGNAGEIWVKEGKHEIVLSSQFVTVYKPGEKILFSPSYEGTVSVALRGKNGLIGDTVYVLLEKNTDSIPAEPVAFASARLGKAVRDYLQKGGSETVTVKDLSVIEQIFITGDLIMFNGKGITTEIANQNIPAAIRDLDFSDFDKFPCLSRLTVKYNDTGAPKGNALLSLSYLELTGCGITDIDGLENCRISQLYLTDNRIRNAEILSTARSLEYLSLQMNPLEKIKLPSKPVTNVNLRKTEISDIGFVKSAEALKEIDIGETKVKDVTALLDVPGIIEIYCPSGADCDVLRSIPTLKELYTGDIKADLK